MIRVLVSTPVVLLALTCAVPYGNKEDGVRHSAESSPSETSQRDRGESANIKNTKGVVVLGQYGKGDFVRFYNRDGTLWYEFTYFYEGKDATSKNANDDFRPFAFHQDYFLLVLKCTEATDKLFEVVVNEGTGLKKYVKVNDPVFKFETWEQLVLNTFAVSFDRNTNPLLDAPAGKVENVTLALDVTFRPIEIHGEWLKIRWDTARGQSPNTQNGTGWVRWKKDGNLLVELYYFA